MIIADVAKRLLNATDPQSIGRTVAQLLDWRTLSREIVAAMTDKALKQKDFIVEAIAKEFSKFLAQVNIGDEAKKILEDMTLNISATVDFKNKKIHSKPVTVRKKSKR